MIKTPLSLRMLLVFRHTNKGRGLKGYRVMSLFYPRFDIVYCSACPFLVFISSRIFFLINHESKVIQFSCVGNAEKMV